MSKYLVTNLWEWREDKEHRHNAYIYVCKTKTEAQFKLYKLVYDALHDREWLLSNFCKEIPSDNKKYEKTVAKIASGYAKTGSFFYKDRDDIIKFSIVELNNVDTIDLSAQLG